MMRQLTHHRSGAAGDVRLHEGSGESLYASGFLFLIRVCSMDSHGVGGCFGWKVIPIVGNVYLVLDLTDCVRLVA